MLMAIGRSAPRYEAMAVLYPRSKELRAHMCEYYIVIVRLFHQQVRIAQKSILGQIRLTSFPGEADLKPYQSDLENWAQSIKEEVNLLMARDLVEQSSRSKALFTFSEAET